jgi:hypothetical protein
MSADSQERAAGHEKVERALADLLAAYAACRGPLSAWERHCIEAAILLARHGHFDQAVARIAQVLEPPVPLPVFEDPEPLTIEDVRRLFSVLRHF